MADEPNSDILVPFSAPRATLGAAKEVRSTLVASSLRALRNRRLFDRYEKLLPREYHEQVITSVAGTWLPMEATLAHYTACDALGLLAPEQVAIGMDVAERVHGTLLGTMVRMAAVGGVTPWVAMAQSGRLFTRLFQGGGGIEVRKLGPKEARAELVGVALVRVPYFRNGLLGIYKAGVELFCRRAYVREVPRMLTPIAMGVVVSWA